MNRCSDCRHSRLWPNGLLFCHRYPRTFDGYPEVSPNDDCGEWVEGEAKAGIATVMDEREAARRETDEWAHTVLRALDLPLHRSVEDAVAAIESLASERPRVVAFLRRASQFRPEATEPIHVGPFIDHLAHAVERGEHRWRKT